MTNSNEATRGYPIKFICDKYRYEQIAYINVKPIKYMLRLGAKFICNKCEVEQQTSFMDGEYDAS